MQCFVWCPYTYTKLGVLTHQENGALLKTAEKNTFFFPSTCLSRFSNTDSRKKSKFYIFFK